MSLFKDSFSTSVVTSRGNTACFLSLHKATTRHLQDLVADVARCSSYSPRCLGSERRSEAVCARRLVKQVLNVCLGLGFMCYSGVGMISNSYMNQALLSGDEFTE